MPKISDELLQHYRNAHYQIWLPDGDLTFRIGEQAPALRALHAQYGVTISALLTAYNPGSRATTADVNAAAQESLLAAIRQMGLQFIAAAGIDPQGNWPDEPSLFILGLGRAQASVLARRFGQNACVLIDASGVPEILLSDPDGDR